MRNLLLYRSFIVLVLMVAVFLGGLPVGDHGKPVGAVADFTGAATHYRLPSEQLLLDAVQWEPEKEPVRRRLVMATELSWVSFVKISTPFEQWELGEQNTCLDHREWWWLYPEQNQSNYLTPQGVA